MSIWIEDGLRHITPRGISNPEGFNIGKVLRTFISRGDTVTDLGCGYGRLAEYFAPDQYVGRDINPDAILEAESENPDYAFIQGKGSSGTDWTLLYTVALHIPDDEIADFFNNINTDKLLIAEIMRPDLACPDGIPPAYNRTLGDYDNLLAVFGFHRVNMVELTYSYYKNTCITFAAYVRVTS